ncbi:putative transposase [Candidatus Hakubella thermalkaliphila]|uniref:Putative transposase n=1 Tax=Candidatus Hakubella thermalkaliphila TaxID=2754717 RepID=A0A6V8PZM9_9ACTN|nr:RNA-guided endonuclease TnpB family protein [Candidatus Hakubella thermalkaliphila]GFP19417.1 putative transposase [Candidatus Hakubella thermalkaliphila]GFP36546.1 putative transposase [Candidatus Hakubella thermalkaliphila]GFP40030.1 putative transposase [Candidatus Hakubella thermalkaliphila]
MIKVFKYRLYPTKKQAGFLVFQLEGHRYLYNQALAQRKELYQQTGKGIGYSLQATALLPKLRKENEQLAFCNYSSLQQTLRRLDKAFKAFFARIKSGEKAGPPRFKSAERFNTISYATLGDGCQIKENRLYLQNVGCIKVKWHRSIKGKVKTLSITRRNGKWYVSFAVECDPEPLPKIGKEVGIDLGLKAFVATSDGQQIEAPKYLRKSEKKLVKAQKRLSRRQKGSSRRRKAGVLLAKKHEEVANQRLDFCHKVAYCLVKAYDGFAVETLKVKAMVQNKYLSKSISDASWGMFLLILKGKAESAGRWYREVPSNGTSQRCSGCGEIVKKSLAVRTHNCPHCGLVLDRDQNAALNILKRAWTGPSALASKFEVSPRSCRL